MKGPFDVFGNTLLRFNCAETLYKSEELKNSVDKIFKDPRIITDLGHKEGKVLSTYGLSDIEIINIPGMDTLREWITDSILKSAEPLGYPNASKVNYINTFANRMWPESSGGVHYHKDSFHGVAIFYYYQPSNGSDLYIVPNGFLGATEKDFKSEEIHYLNVQQGELVVHTPTAWHGVTVNNSSEERTVLVFEFRYE